MIPDHIALYGLLRPGHGPFERMDLGAALEPAGPCLIRGMLHDLGPYPGLRPGDGTVRGQLYRIRDGRVLRRLDAFEDYDPRRPRRSLYLRRPVRLLEPAVVAWIYAYNRAPPAGSRIAGGTWTPGSKAQRLPRTSCS
ncbi:MAG: gamma-glutamylcyclotransferase [Alphaproteobacteria bacterium]|nr:gamma-glutamylcyclotransferase [Alphaproteobacteria bacterium]